MITQFASLLFLAAMVLCAVLSSHAMECARTHSHKLGAFTSIIETSVNARGSWLSPEDRTAFQKALEAAIVNEDAQLSLPNKVQLESAFLALMESLHHPGPVFLFRNLWLQLMEDVLINVPNARIQLELDSITREFDIREALKSIARGVQIQESLVKDLAAIQEGRLVGKALLEYFAGLDDERALVSAEALDQASTQLDKIDFETFFNRIDSSLVETMISISNPQESDYSRSRLRALLIKFVESHFGKKFFDLSQNYPFPSWGWSFQAEKHAITLMRLEDFIKYFEASRANKITKLFRVSIHGTSALLNHFSQGADRNGRDRLFNDEFDRKTEFFLDKIPFAHLQQSEIDFIGKNLSRHFIGQVNSLSNSNIDGLNSNSRVPLSKLIPAFNLLMDRGFFQLLSEPVKKTWLHDINLRLKPDGKGKLVNAAEVASLMKALNP